MYLRKINAKHFISLLIGASAASLQLIVTLEQTFRDNYAAFSFSNSASLIACVIVIGLLLASSRKPLQAIFLAVYPCAALSVITLLAFNDSSQSFSPQSSGIFIHVILSLIAYSVFSIAAVQALLVHMQNNNLKKRNHTILMRNLPPLLTMENLLFEMLWSGTILLALAILAGFIFVDDLFAQHLAHKTVLSILALLTFSALLAGRKIYGWRGITASKWTLWGFSLLMLGFFGSKLVLETISK
ncbi:hypothetical protein A3752_05800 [Oleiphilus sp. HI0081]|nr:hypothetical protein A3732_02085 [Oleiphilus sp. HI0050]KZZ23129.1 hypothetical protein A3752_05800 [Oleiphilus sp. HI0081]